MIQITMTIDENTPIGQFLIARAQETGKSGEEVASAETIESILARIRMLHEQFINGEFSQGYMADLLGISRLDLINLLDAMGLPSANA
jgi:hypothetical protein